VNAIEYLELTPLDEKKVKICYEEKILKIATAIRTSYFNVGVCLPLQDFFVKSLPNIKLKLLRGNHQKKVLHTGLPSIGHRNTF
jgi:hypothetical protein